MAPPSFGITVNTPTIKGLSPEGCAAQSVIIHKSICQERPTGGGQPGRGSAGGAYNARQTPHIGWWGVGFLLLPSPQALHP